MKIKLILLLAISFLGCSSESKTLSRPYEGELKKICDYQFEFDSSKNFSGELSGRNISRYYFDEKTKTEYLSLYLFEFNKIEYYNLSTGALTAQLNVCPIADCYYTHNFDSIFVTMRNSTLVKLYNIKGELINEYDYGEYLKPSEGKYQSQCICNSFPEFRNNTLYFRVTNDRNYFTESGVLIMKLGNPSGIEECHLTAPFPDGYEKQFDYYYNCYPGFAIKDGSVYMSFSVEHDVMVFSQDRLLNRIEAKCDHLKEFSKDSRKDFRSEVAFITQCGMFFSFCYDEYHRLFYRVAQLEVPPKERKKPEKLMKKEWALCVFDDDFQKLNEFVVEHKENDMGCILPTKKGFLALKSATDTIAENGEKKSKMVWTLYQYVR